MISPVIKNEIRDCYIKLKSQLPNFTPRQGQNYLVAELVKTLAGEYDALRRIFVAEAGTGIGKSLAYLIGTIPFALNNHKKVVISTATVALQEQLIKKDLPLFQQIYATDFQYALAKGRNRYCCAGKLAASLNPEDLGQESLFNDPSSHVGSSHTSTRKKESDEASKKENSQLLAALYQALTQGEWDGDLDTWRTPIPADIWASIASDKHNCNSRLHLHRQCPFAKARLKLSEAQVIVVNHHLLMADIELGGGIILPSPEDTLYILDEGHHFPTIARDFSAAAASLIGASKWLQTLQKNADKYAQSADIKTSIRFLDTLLEEITYLIPTLKDVNQHLHAYTCNEDHLYRFEHGTLPPFLLETAKHIHVSTNKLYTALNKIYDLILERVNEKQIMPTEAQSLLADTSFFLHRIENLNQVWKLMAKSNPDKGAPLARWFEKCPENHKDFIIHVSPLEVGFQLEQQLWSKAAGIGIFSATLRALNSFDFFCRYSGLSQQDGTQFRAIQSPFNYAEKARLVIPAIKILPQDPNFTQQLPELIFKYLEGQKASLVLFSSYWQMNQVAQNIRERITQRNWCLHVQGEKSREQILKSHQDCCEQQKVSILFGTSSFAEGLDLPRDLLTNLIITKIPFAVPSSPIEQAYSEYIEKQGGNSFLQITVPDASKKLTQAVGRLIRTEYDSGQVILLDRRIINKQYGKSLLDALPPMTRVIENHR